MPKAICLVTPSALAMNSSGDGIFSQGRVKCSPIQASEYPSLSVLHQLQVFFVGIGMRPFRVVQWHKEESEFRINFPPNFRGAVNVGSVREKFFPFLPEGE